MVLSTAVLIADTMKSAYLSKSLVDVSSESLPNLARPRVLIRILLCQSGQICTWGVVSRCTPMWWSINGDFDG